MRSSKRSGSVIQATLITLLAVGILCLGIFATALQAFAQNEGEAALVGEQVISEGYITFFTMSNGEVLLTSSFSGKVYTFQGHDYYNHIYWQEKSGRPRSLRDHANLSYTLSEHSLGAEDGVVLSRNPVE